MRGSKRTAAVLAVLALLALLATGCGEAAPNAGAAGGGGPGLDGTEWVLVAGVPMVDGYPITLRVDDGEVGGTAACNSYGGSVDMDGDRFVVGDIMQTEMGCPDEGVHDSEAAYLSALRSVERHEQPDDRLVLLGTDVELRFEPVAPEEDAALVGTRWALESLMLGSGPEGTVSSTMAQARLRLDAAGSFRASDGCNDIGGRWTQEGDVLRLDPFDSTGQDCEGLTEQMDHVDAVLTARPTVVLDGPRLQLTAGERGLDYRAVE